MGGREGAVHTSPHFYTSSSVTEKPPKGGGEVIWLWEEIFGVSGYSAISKKNNVNLIVY